jgi:hypothetical protein
MRSRDRYQELYSNFRWRVPDAFDIGRESCGKWAADREPATRQAQSVTEKP